MNRRESLKLLGSAAFAAAAASPRRSHSPKRQPAADGPFKLPPLGYANEALEPHIDAQTMMIHHDRHHAAYVNACNEFAKQVPELGTTPIEKTLVDAAYIPLQIQTQVKNNLGGHWNHTFFWDLMTPGGAKEPSGELKAAIESSWKDVDDFKEKFAAAGRRALRLGLGLARAQQGQEDRADHDRQPGHAGRARREGDHRRRCLGARLLSQVPEPPAGLPQGLVERGELGQGRGELQEGAGVTHPTSS